MKRVSSTLAMAITGLLLAAGPALAQGSDDRARPGAGSDRPAAAGGGSTASAGTNAGGSVSSGGGAGGGSGSTSSGGGSSTSSFDWPSLNSGNVPPPKAERRTNREKPKAAPRAETAGSTSDTNHTANGDAPTWSRPRGDRPATDIAVTRVGPRPPRDSGERKRTNVPTFFCPAYVCGDVYPQDPFYPPYYYTYGLSIWYGLDWGNPWGIPSDVIDPRTYDGQEQGSLKLKVKPRHAKVYVDGYFVGSVDDFDGAFQKLKLNGGRHTVEIRAEGFETIELDVRITPDKTATFTETMKKLQ